MKIPVVKNAFWGSLGELVSRLAKIAQIILIARLLGAEELGRFNHAVAFVGLFAVMFDLGVVPLVTRTLASDPCSAALRLFIRVKLLASSLGLALLVGTVLVSNLPLTDIWLVIGIGVYVVFTDFGTFVTTVYRANRQFWKETIWRSVIAVLQMVVCALALLIWRHVAAVVIGLIVVAVLGIASLALETRRQPTLTNRDSGWRGLWRAVRSSLPFAGLVLTGSIYTNFDTVILAKHVTMEEVAMYSVAVKLALAVLIMPVHYLYLAFLPEFAGEMAGKGIFVVKMSWLKSFLFTIVAGALLCLGAALFSELILLLLFGRDFLAAAPLVVVFALTGFMYYLYVPMAQWLMLINRQRDSFFIQLLAVAINIVAVQNWVVDWGMWGAVWAVLMTHFSIAFIHAILVFRDFELNDRTVDLYAVLRVVIGLVSAIVIMHLQIGGAYGSRFIAVLCFICLTIKELRLFFSEVRVVWQRSWSKTLS